MTTFRVGDRVRVIAPHSDHHHKTGTIERVNDVDWSPALITVKLEMGGKIVVGGRALVLVAP